MAACWSPAGSSVEHGTASSPPEAPEALGAFKLGQLLGRRALTRLLGKPRRLCNTGSKGDDGSSPAWPGSGRAEALALAAACGDTRAPRSFKHSGVFVL